MDIENILKRGREATEKAADLRALDDVRVAYLGKKGELTSLLKSLGQVDADERPKVGAKINEAKVAILEDLAVRKNTLEQAALSKSLLAEKVDVSLPGRRPATGGLHPVTQAMYRIEEIFTGKKGSSYLKLSN